MGQPVIQTSFNSGEWAPHLYSRVDLSKYHSGAALLSNFFVDYRGGATTRPGTRYVLQARTNTVRLIPFQASFNITYILEFGAGYIRFFNNGQPVLESATSISGQTPGAPVIFSDTGHGYSNGDWIFANNTYYIVQNALTNSFTLTDLFGNAINVNPFGSFPVNAQRVYTLFGSPFQAADLYQIKYAQNVNQLILCHPNYAPQVLTLNSATNWTIGSIQFGSTVTTPTGTGSATTLSAGSVDYAYIITAVDVNGQESAGTAPVSLTSLQDIRTSAGTNTITWSAVSGAVSYNVYKANPRYGTPVPSGAQYGFMSNVTGTTAYDSNITPDFSSGPPIPQNPFQGTGVQTITLLTKGSAYTTVPLVTLTAAPGGGTTAQAYCYLELDTISLRSGGTGYQNNNNNVLHVTITLANGIAFDAQCQFGTIIAFTPPNAQQRGTLTSNPVPAVLTDTGNGGNTLGGFVPSIWNVTWRVGFIALNNPGTGYIVPPSVTFSSGTATASTTLGAPSAGNPTVPGFIQQRMFLGGPVQSPSQLNLSQPGSFFNYNTTFPEEADNAIEETLTNTVLNTIKAVVSVSAGLVVFTDKGAWLINGGSGAGSPISALAIVANPQSYSGSSDLPPIVTNQDILYVQAKGSIVRDLAFNFYLNNYVGEDVSVLSSHLFYGFSLVQWAWAEEPFKVAWAVRNDGSMLSFTFVKEQELLAWSHHNTQGQYTSNAVVNENTAIGNVDAHYQSVLRTVNSTSVVYIERTVEINYPNDYISSWQVDAGIGYSGAAATTFSGAQHLGGLAVTGVADGVVINFTMPVSGTFVFGPGGTAGLTGIASASVVTVGLGYTPMLQTLPLDLGEPTVQGKRKKISGVSIKVLNALGLNMGRTFSTVLPLQDLIIGNVGSVTGQQVTGLVTGEVRGFNDPLWDTPGQYVITQPLPYPATILGVVPEIDVGDTP